GWLGHSLVDGNDDSPGVRSFERPSEPPPEYLYLDTSRALAYLAQIEDGLTSNEKRTIETTVGVTAKAGTDGLEASSTAQRVGFVSQDVTAAATDRFYKLLGALQGGFEKNDRTWLWDVNARPRPGAMHAALATLGKLSIGDFVRIRHATMYLPPYAQVYPRTSYALNYVGGRLPAPRRPLYAPPSAPQAKAIKAYRAKVGKRPRISFVAPLFDESKGPAVSFVVPVQYRGLTSEPSSLSGEVTIVGKVIYLDVRDGTTDKERQWRWVDRQMLHDFGPAVRQAPPELVKLLGLKKVPKSQRVAAVRDNVSFEPPLAVVLPVAIYQ
ncbi:MAG TPA: hypothetical protein VNT55_04735, partial [Baekduia sp.]|nr:hypothetical protein [Baekduia sp.]